MTCLQKPMRHGRQWTAVKDVRKKGYNSSSLITSMGKRDAWREKKKPAKVELALSTLTDYCELQVH